MPPCARKRPPYASQVVEGKDVALALRCLPAHDAVFDQTDNFPPPPRYQASASYNCFRFVDSVMHFKPEELNVLPPPPPPNPPPASVPCRAWAALTTQPLPASIRRCPPLPAS